MPAMVAVAAELPPMYLGMLLLSGKEREVLELLLLRCMGIVKSTWLPSWQSLQVDPLSFVPVMA